MTISGDWIDSKAVAAIGKSFSAFLCAALQQVAFL